MKNNTNNIVITSMMAALVCAATIIIKIPAPLNGYLNAGDGIVLVTGWMLSPFYSFFASGFGSALADIIGGFPLYAPVTFIIKGVMSLVAYVVNKKLELSHVNMMRRRIFAAIVAELIMVAGYMLFEIALYGLIPSVANLPANLIQGAFGVVSGVMLINFFSNNNI